MPTARDLIYDAMYGVGILGQGDTAPSAGDAQLGLRRLQRMLDMWANERLLVFSSSLESMALAQGVQAYDCADLSTPTRPVKVTSGYVRWGAIDYELELVNDKQWDLINDKATQGVPSQVHYEPTMVGEFKFWPVPSDTMTAYFNCVRPLTATMTLDTVLSLPAGYEHAIVANLEVELGSGGFGVTATPIQMKRAADAKSALAATNYQPIVMQTPFASVPGDNYDIKRGPF